MRTFHYITNTAEHFANMTEHNRIFHYQIQPWLRRIRIQFIQRFLSKRDFYLALRDIFTTSNRVLLAIGIGTGVRRLPTEFDFIKSVIRFLSERDFYFSLQDIFHARRLPTESFWLKQSEQISPHYLIFAPCLNGMIACEMSHRVFCALGLEKG